MHTLEAKPAINPHTTDTDIAIGQMLALAELANVAFTAADGRLMVRSSRMDPKHWSTIRWYLDQIGVPAIIDYFNRTTDKDRAALSAPA
jgi:hypothetical protein